MKWTAEQREAIEYSGENILLAAAAGSGKTAVLVQRIIEQVSGKETDISDLLVLTFTDAAAGEMRGKIASAVRDALEKNPGDLHLKKQALLIHSSSISTVHSFCLNLLKSNIHLTDIPVNFSLVSETENKIMLKEALDEVLERYYGRIDKNPSFKNLALGYGGVKNDDTLRAMLLALMKFVKSMAYPSKWLNNAVDEYRFTAENGRLSDNILRQLWELTEESAKELLGIYRSISEEMERVLFEDHPYVDFFAEEGDVIKNLFNDLYGKAYSYIRSRLYSFEFPRMKTGIKKAEGEIAAAQERIKAQREKAKKCLNNLKECFRTEETDVISRISLSYPVVRTLKNIVLTVERSYTKRKRSKNYLDFNDLEHETLKLLVDKEGNPKETALKLRKKYKEILVDEYQDTNNIQDEIFRVISRDNKNIFMVGDLKQSIYKFRNAVPALFSDKYDLYAREENPGHLIRLFKNFRSRRGVVDMVNFIFDGVMSRENGDVDYTREEYLIEGAQYNDIPPENQFDSELYMLCRNSEGEDGGDETDRTELEARMAAKRILEITGGEMTVYDKGTDTYRRAEYRDIVILMRNTKQTAPVFERVLEENNIPVYTDIGKSYLGSVEVQTVMSFLQIIDNPLQDIPLIAVLRSPIWSFSSNELADIRSGCRNGYFFDALTKSAREGNSKSADFLNKLEALRKRAEYTGVDELIHCIYYEYGYYAYSGASSHGTQRQANLRLLFERAAEFEHSRMSGLFNFMNYIEAIRDTDGDLTPAKIFGEGENVVRIMSIHKSKGLEFPVVILADTAHRFNTEDLKKNVRWHEKSGLGVDYTDTRLRVRYPSLPRTLINMQAKQEMRSEEMRLLYVALTRAREKLIITATFSAREGNWRQPMWSGDGKTLLSYVKGSQCFRDWITAAMMRHPGAKPLREYCGIGDGVVAKSADFGFKAFLYDSCEKVMENTIPTAAEAEHITDETVMSAEEIKARLDFKYPNTELLEIPVKLSVSEVKRMQSDEEYVPLIESLRTFELSDVGNITAAERGTVTHFILQYADHNKIKSTGDVEKLIAQMQAEGIISKKMADSINSADISRFFKSGLGDRMRRADRVEKEFSFYTRASADEIYGNGLKTEILLQGTIDCFMINQDRVTLIDFKTDNVRNRAEAEERAKKYAVQMKYYKKGLAEILDKEIDESYLYFLNTGDIVEV